MFRLKELIKPLVYWLQNVFQNSSSTGTRFENTFLSCVGGQFLPPTRENVFPFLNLIGGTGTGTRSYLLTIRHPDNLLTAPCRHLTTKGLTGAEVPQ